MTKAKKERELNGFDKLGTGEQAAVIERMHQICKAYLSPSAEQQTICRVFERFERGGWGSINYYLNIEQSWGVSANVTITIEPHDVNAKISWSSTSRDVTVATAAIDLYSSMVKGMSKAVASLRDVAKFDKTDEGNTAFGEASDLYFNSTTESQ